MKTSEKKVYEILIVDDHKENLQLLDQFLSAEGYKIRSATDGETALMSINAKRPDMILLDIKMPIMDGYEVCKILKSDETTASIPIIFISGMDDTESKVEAFRAGGVDFITKPFANEEVLARVSMHLNIEDIIESKTKEIKEKDEMLMLQSRQAAMGEMISMIAHQWRQPLSSISMEANNILADVELDEVNPKDLTNTAKSINNHIDELSKTIDDFRNFFKPNKDIVKTTIKQVVDDSYNVIGKSLENNNIETKFEVEDVTIETYPRELMQVFLNILKNAKEALLERDIPDATISIFAKKGKETVLVEIVDNAGGIEEGIIDKIFNPYFTTKSEKNGTGLGLYMSSTIIKKHLNGKISVSNKGGGASFSIELPLELKPKK